MTRLRITYYEKGEERDSEPEPLPASADLNASANALPSAASPIKSDSTFEDHDFLASDFRSPTSWIWSQVKEGIQFCYSYDFCHVLAGP